MKFSKRLRTLSTHIEKVLPEWEGMFLSYKDLKKQLKVVYPKEGENSRPNKRRRLDQETDGGDSSAGAEEEEKVAKETILVGESSRPDKQQGLDQKTEGGDSLAGEEEVVAPVVKDVMDFEILLGKEIEKFNGFFMDKEEEYVIRLKVSFITFPYFSNFIVYFLDSNQSFSLLSVNFVSFP